jgi:hemoglobin
MPERSVAPENEPHTDFERIGGTPAVVVVVDQFYGRILADPQLAPFFTDVNLSRLRRHQVQMISQVLGGPVTYDGADLKTAHRGLEIGPDDFKRVAEHLVATLEANGVAPDIIARVGGVLSAVEPDVVDAGAR